MTESKEMPIVGSDHTITKDYSQWTDAQLRWEGLWARAEIAAYDADESAAPRFEGRQGLDCGFAWVTLNDGRSGFARHLRKRDPLEYSGSERIRIHMTEYASEQSVDLHQICAEAFAQVLERAGVKCSVGWCFD
jgi:hypothetical protein